MKDFLQDLELKLLVQIEIEKLDDRIKVYHKKNEGVAATRDYGVEKASTNI